MDRSRDRDSHSGVFTVLFTSFRLKRKKQLTLSPCFAPECQLCGVLAPAPGSRRPVRRSFYLHISLHFRDRSLAVADEEFSPCSKLPFLRSPCKQLLMHLEQQMSPGIGEPSLRRSSTPSRGLSPRMGRQHPSS